MAYRTRYFKNKSLTVKTSEEALELLYDFYSECIDIDIIAETLECLSENITNALKQLNIYNKKICPSCNKWKDFSDYCIDRSRKTGLKVHCKECSYAKTKLWILNNSEHVKDYSRQYILKNRKQIEERSIIYRKQNRKILAQKSLNYYNIHKIERSQYQKNRFNIEENIEKRREWQRNWSCKKRKEDISYRIRSIFSSRIHKILKKNKTTKKDQSIIKWIPFSFDDLKCHLESQFKPGMTWNNYGQWHIDHIKPISLFNITSLECDDFKECWSLNNLQPLWAHENLLKSNTYN